MPIDDSAADNALRAVAVGRKNDLHLGSGRGGRTAAVLMSLVQSSRGPGNAPHADLHDLLNCVSTHPASRVDGLSPDRRGLPGR